MDGKNCWDIDDAAPKMGDKFRATQVRPISTGYESFSLTVAGDNYQR